MDDKKVVAVLFYYLNQGQGDNHIVEYIMMDKNGKYTRREYYLQYRDWLYQLEWYQKIKIWKYIDTEILQEWYYKNKSIITIPHIFKDTYKIPLEFTKYIDNHGK